MASDTIVLALKAIFSEAGIPTILIINNGCQFTSDEFKAFAIEWNFTHKTSSPYYPKGNNHAERAVGVVKEIYSKCKEEFLLRLLVHRATPLLYTSNTKSPAELFFSHKFSTNNPVIPYGHAAVMQHYFDNHDHEQK